MKIQKKDVDIARVFTAFLALGGDVRLTAAAMQLDADMVRSLAEEWNWAAKLDQHAVLKEKDGNYQISLNRVVNYVQARQLSAIIDTVISKLSSLTGEELIAELTQSSKSGSSFTTRPLTDLVRAAEAVQAMASRALGDTGGAEAAESNAGQLSVDVARALNSVAYNRGVDAVTIVRQSLDGNTELPPVAGK